MRWIKILRLRLRSCFRRNRLEQELDEELRYHVEREIAANIAGGMAVEDARHAAVKSMGGIEQRKEVCRDARGFVAIDEIGQDLRYALRTLRKSPGFTTVALLSLGLGIGANTAIFSIVHAVMLEALPVEEPQRLVQVTTREWSADPTSMTHPIWEQVRDRGGVFDGAFAFASAPFDVASSGVKQLVSGLYVSGDFFSTLGVEPFAGRLLTREDDQHGGGTDGPVAVLSHTYWRDQYGASPDAVGRRIHLDGQLFTIVGVAPPGFFGPSVGSRFDVAVPLEQSWNGMLGRPGNWWLSIMGRLEPGASLEQAQARLRVLQPQIRLATMPDPPWAGHLADPFTLVPASTGASSLRTGYHRALLTLMGAVGLVLLIACANLANLLLARATARRKEFAVRLALGASRARLARQLLTESLALALGGAALGLLLARWASALIVRQISTTRSSIFLDLSVDGSILGFTMGVATLTALIVGLAPALRSTDVRANDLLKSSARSIAQGWRGFTLEKLLVTSQIALSLVLVFGAALFVRSFATLATLDPGFDRHRLLVVTADGRQSEANGQTQVQAQRWLEALRKLPGVRSAAGTAQIAITNNQWGSSAFVRGREASVLMNRVSPGYFATMGTPIYAGRDFTTQDTPNGPAVAIVNETFAHTFFRGANPVGETFEQPGPDKTRETLRIVGVVKDSKYLDLRQPEPATVYIAFTQSEAVPRHFVLRTELDTATLMRSVTQAARRLDPDLALEMRSFDTIVNDSLTQERLLAMLSGFFGTLALLVAGIGLYGMMSLAVSRRRNEIALRMALGARPSAVVNMVLREVAFVTLIGLGIGIVVGVTCGRLVDALLFGVESSDVPTWLLAIGTLAAAAGLASYLPARHAARLGPMLALREE